MDTQPGKAQFYTLSWEWSLGLRDRDEWRKEERLAFIVHLLCAPGTAPSVRETGEQDTYLPPSLTQVGRERVLKKRL